MQEKNLSEMMITIGQSARQAARVLALITNEIKNNALRAMAAAIRLHQASIQSANEKIYCKPKKKAYPLRL